MNIHIFLVCGNEEILLPSAINHYRSRFPSATITVLDNESTDSSVSIAKSLGCTVQSWSTNNEINEPLLRHLKNNVWKTVQNGWVIVCDMDEWLEINESLLQNEDSAGTTILKTQGYNIVVESQSETLTDINLSSCFDGIQFDKLSKSICFKVPNIQEINFTLGAHKASPVGTVNYSTTVYMLRHMTFLGIPFRWKRMQFLYPRSESMRQRKLDLHYVNTLEEVKKRFNDWYSIRENIVSIHQKLYPTDIEYLNIFKDIYNLSYPNISKSFP